MKIWRYHPEECEFCGGESEIYTDDFLDEGYGFGDDEMRCKDCGSIGTWSVYAEDDAYCNWVVDNTIPHREGI